MPLIDAPMISRRAALAAAAALLAWRPTFAAPAPAPATDTEALHVLNRLAFGPAPGDLDRVMQRGVGAWISEQLHPEDIALPAALAQQLGALESPKASQRDLIGRYRELQRQAKQAAANDPVDAPGTRGKPKTPERDEQRELIKALYIEAGEARLLQALASPRQLEEVMVDFWFNHFNVYEAKGLDRVLVENYEREAIRPHVFGRFRAMLGATAKHPAMLFYLDNWISFAPGYRRGKHGTGPATGGLNENYAREVMELHTLGVDGGYTQQDVTELARILTGWTMEPGEGRRRAVFETRGGDSLFAFDPERHDPGTKTWLGNTVAPSGQAEGEFALDVLARHPSTATHIATQLARHFVADDPPRVLVDRVARRFTETDGDLRAVLREVVDSAEFRDAGRGATKFKTPYQYVVSAVRATGIATTNVRPLITTLKDLGQPLFGCQTPDGYKDTEADWLNPNAITQRVDFATALASGRLPLARAADADDRLGRGLEIIEPQGDRATSKDAPVAGSTPPVDADALLATLGPSISAKTRAAIDRSPPALRAALALGSPDFMRR